MPRHPSLMAGWVDNIQQMKQEGMVASRTWNAMWVRDAGDSPSAVQPLSSATCVTGCQRSGGLQCGSGPEPGGVLRPGLCWSTVLRGWPQGGPSRLLKFFRTVRPSHGQADAFQVCLKLHPLARFVTCTSQARRSDAGDAVP